MSQRIRLFEKTIQKREKIANQSPIKIRDLIAYQKNDAEESQNPIGEFAKQNKKQESQSHMIARMVEHVDMLASHAEKAHIKDNFIQTDKYISANKVRELAYQRAKQASLSEPSEEAIQQEIENILTINHSYFHPQHLNDITRLSLNEFSLYPHAEQGPLSLEGFHQLISKLEEMARYYPQNLHLMIATMPVKLTDNQVHNMAIHIQCGKLPIIHPFAKAIPSTVDPVYPNTVNPNFTSVIPSQQIISELFQQIKNIYQMLKNNPQALTDKDVSMAYELCEKLEPDSPLCASLKQIQLNVKQNSYSKGKDTDRLLNADLDYLKKEAPLFLEKVNQKITEQTKKIPSAVLSDGSKNGMSLFYGGNVVCKTAGGAVFRLAADICLDQLYSVAKNLVVNDINLAQRHGAYSLPSRASYVLMSNSIDFVSDYSISDTQVQADPLYSDNKLSVLQGNKYLKPEKTKVIENPVFGPQTIMDNYPVREMSTHKEELKKQIDEHNQFIIILKALQHNQELENNFFINKQINEHILSPIIVLLNKNNVLLSEVTQLKATEGDFQQSIYLLEKLELKIGKKEYILPDKIYSALQNAISLLKIEQKRQMILSKHAKNDKQQKNVKPNVRPSSFSGVSISDYCYNGSTDSQFLTGTNFFSQSFLPDQSQSQNFPNEQCSVGNENVSSDSSSVKPSSFTEALMLFSCFVHYYSPFTLPWNRIQPLTTAEKSQLYDCLNELDELQAAFIEKKKKRAFRFQIHEYEYTRVAELLKRARTEAIYMLSKNKKASAQFSSVRHDIDCIKELIPQLTNKELEKKLRYEEVHLKRIERRSHSQ